MFLTVAAAAVLGFAVLPAQAAAPGSSPVSARRLGMTAGIFNVLRAVVVVLTVTRPGSRPRRCRRIT